MKIGDKVKFNGKYGFTDDEIHIVTSEPWGVNGKILVRLDDKNGGWLVDGLEVVDVEAYSRS